MAKTQIHSRKDRPFISGFNVLFQPKKEKIFLGGLVAQTAWLQLV
jgi:hypothetical protein